jgi:Fibronectin type III domain
MYAFRRRRSGRALTHAALAGLMAGGITMVAGQAVQAVPAPPHNIVVFPQRDFVVLEGYTNRLTEVGKTATVVVTRGGVETSRATGTISAGDPSLEINHPGGVCWQGVTPDIKPGDVVRVTAPGVRTESTIVQAAEVSPQGGDGFRKVGDFDLVVEGVRAAGFPLGRMEQRIVNPDMDPTDVGRRDVRAPARPGPYTSSLTGPTPTTWRATYHFVTDGDTTAAEATQMRDIAAEGQMRALSWEATAGDERQGLTISEFGEAGGPGFGGCPTGPETVAPNAPTNVAATAGTEAVTATWSRATIVPDGSPVTGYQVKAVNTVNNVGTSIQVPLCTTGCTATIPSLLSGVPYRIEVRALSAAGLGKKGEAPNTVAPRASAAIQPATATAVTATAGDLTDLSVDASVSWTAPAQPGGVTIEAWRITAYDATSLARVKRVFVDEPADASDASRSRTVGFASARSVMFRVQAVAADDSGTMSALSAASDPVMAQ